MTNENHNPANPQADEKAWDDAVSARLGQLRSAPVDLSNLRARIDSQIRQEHPKVRAKNPILRMIWAHHLQAIAALFIFVVLAGVIINALSNPSIASAQEMFQVHDDLVAGRIPVSRVTSIEDATKSLVDSIVAFTCVARCAQGACHGLLHEVDQRQANGMCVAGPRWRPCDDDRRQG